MKIFDTKQIQVDSCLLLQYTYLKARDSICAVFCAFIVYVNEVIILCKKLVAKNYNSVKIFSAVTWK